LIPSTFNSECVIVNMKAIYVINGNQARMPWILNEEQIYSLKKIFCLRWLYSCDDENVKVLDFEFDSLQQKKSAANFLFSAASLDGAGYAN
jgi:hypothetical protein